MGLGGLGPCGLAPTSDTHLMQGGTGYRHLAAAVAPWAQSLCRHGSSLKGCVHMMQGTNRNACADMCALRMCIMSGSEPDLLAAAGASWGRAPSVPAGLAPWGTAP